MATVLLVTVTLVANDPAARRPMNSAKTIGFIQTISHIQIGKTKRGKKERAFARFPQRQPSYATVTVIVAGALNVVRAVSIWKIIVCPADMLAGVVKVSVPRVAYPVPVFH